MAKKELCHSCSAKLSGRVSFCPKCGRPTPHASHQEVLDFEKSQWRSHLERTQAVRGAGGSAAGTMVAARPVEAAPSIITRPAPRPAPAPERPRREPKQRRVKEPRQKTPRTKAPRTTAAPKTKERRFHFALPKVRLLPKIEPREQEDRVIDLEVDPAFVYTACTTCQRADWIMRTTQNEDRSWNYWCVWCSKSFKTDLKLPFGNKPFIAAGVVVALLVVASLLIR